MQDNVLSILNSYGLEIGNLEADKIVRVNARGSNSKSGWYIYFSDPICVVYGDWRIGETNIWKPEREYSREEAVIISNRIKEARIQGEEIRKEKNEQAKSIAREVWESSEKVVDHPYLENKSILGISARVKDGELKLPIYSPQKELVSIQSVFENGQKRFLPGGRIKGCFIPIKGYLKTIYVCEGYATGETIHNITNSQVFCALNAGNLKEVADWVSEKYPCNELVICADDDHETKDRIGENVGRLKAEAAAASSGATVIYPKFRDPKGKSDFNDMLLEVGGYERMEGIIYNRPAPSSLIFDTIGDIMSEPIKPKEWLIKDLILANTTVSLYGPSGSLKSFFAIDLGLSIACGHTFSDSLGFLGKPIKQGRVMYLCGEGMDGIRGRLEAWQDVRGIKVPHDMFMVSRGATMVDKQHDRKRLISMVRKCRPELLIIDTLRRNFSGHENDSKEVSEFVAAIDEIKNCCRCTVLVVAHTGKDTTRGEMGSVVLRNAVDTRIRLKRSDEDKPEHDKDEKPIVTVSVSKQKDGREGVFCDFASKGWVSDKIADYTSLTLEYMGEPRI